MKSRLALQMFRTRFTQAFATEATKRNRQMIASERSQRERSHSHLAAHRAGR